MHAIHEALLSGIGNKPSFSSFSVVRRSLPNERPSTSTATTTGTTVRRRHTESDLSLVEPVPMTEAKSNDHVTSGVAMSPKVMSESKAASVQESTPPMPTPANNGQPGSSGSFMPSSIRS
ncbi:hypothetical protein ABW21_db0208060 [Orbilia brochopaga]|nr:hypothetical protein ABW21_db0208060 [Drechslerella brochopaga]